MKVGVYYRKRMSTAKDSFGSAHTESPQLTTSPVMLFLTHRKSNITLVLKLHPSSLLYNSWGRICICIILWLLRCMNGFLKKFYDQEVFYVTELCSSLLMERECFTMKYLSICYFWTMSVMKGYDKVIVNTVFLMSTCPPSTSTTLLPPQLDTGWSLFTLNMNTAKKKKPFHHLFVRSFVHAQSGSALQRSAPWSCLMCVIRCVLALLSLWELELCPSSTCWQPSAWTVW